VHLPPRWRIIGHVSATPHADASGIGITVDGAPHAGPGGWQHFR
jgi:hypothetical protein